MQTCSRHVFLALALALSKVAVIVVENALTYSQALEHFVRVSVQLHVRMSIRP